LGNSNNKPKKAIKQEKLIFKGTSIPAIAPEAMVVKIEGK
jgi:hypothetical protein